MIRRANFFSSSTRISSSSLSLFSNFKASRRSVMLYGGVENNPDEVQIVTENTPVDSMYRSCVTQGKYLLSENRLEYVHRAYLGIIPLIDSHNPIETYDDYLAATKQKVRASNLLLIKRNFSEYSDYRDPVLNASFGLSDYQFDTYAWNHRLCFEFQDYVEKYFPISEHSHLTYFEYTNLLRYFFYSYVGIPVKKCLGPKDRLRPEYGVAVPEKSARAPVILYRKWLEKFQKTIGINRALVIKSGSGLVSMVTRLSGVRMVQGVDSDPRAIISAKRDSMQNRFVDLSFKVAGFFPEVSEEEAARRRNRGEEVQKKYDMIVFAPDFEFLQLSEKASHGVDNYAPSMTGYRGDLEQFFEEANDHLTERGVIVILTSNFLQLTYPKETHPIELEIKANRRWVLLDYFDENISHAAGDVQKLGTRVKLLRDMSKDLRAELWVLHRVESLYHFGWIHGIPGTVKKAGGAPGSEVGFGSGGMSSKKFAERRMRMMKDKVIDEGGDWGEYKDRMLKAMVNEGVSGGDGSSMPPDDDFSKSVKMALDPTYASKLAQQSKKLIMEKLAAEKTYRERVKREFSSDDFSPRDKFDQEQNAILGKFSDSKKIVVTPVKNMEKKSSMKKKKEIVEEEDDDEVEETSL